MSADIGSASNTVPMRDGSSSVPLAVRRRMHVEPLEVEDDDETGNEAQTCIPLTAGDVLSNSSAFSVGGVHRMGGRGGGSNIVVGKYVPQAVTVGVSSARRNDDRSHDLHVASMHTGRRASSRSPKPRGSSTSDNEAPEPMQIQVQHTPIQAPRIRGPSGEHGQDTAFWQWSNTNKIAKTDTSATGAQPVASPNGVDIDVQLDNEGSVESEATALPLMDASATATGLSAGFLVLVLVAMYAYYLYSFIVELLHWDDFDCDANVGGMMPASPVDPNMTSNPNMSTTAVPMLPYRYHHPSFAASVRGIYLSYSNDELNGDELDVSSSTGTDEPVFARRTDMGKIYICVFCLVQSLCLVGGLAFSAGMSSLSHGVTALGVFVDTASIAMLGWGIYLYLSGTVCTFYFFDLSLIYCIVQLCLLIVVVNTCGRRQRILQSKQLSHVWPRDVAEDDIGSSEREEEDVDEEEEEKGGDVVMETPMDDTQQRLSGDGARKRRVPPSRITASASAYAVPPRTGIVRTAAPLSPSASLSSSTHLPTLQPFHHPAFESDAAQSSSSPATHLVNGNSLRDGNVPLPLFVNQDSASSLAVSNATLNPSSHPALPATAASMPQPHPSHHYYDDEDDEIHEEELQDIDQ